MRQVLLLCVLSSCGPPPLEFQLHAHGNGPFVAVTGVALHQPVFVTTPGKEQRSLPSKPLCTVIGPSGAAVECRVSDWERPSLDEDNGVAKLTFVLPEPGSYVVTATLPEGGEVTWQYRAIALFKGEQLAQLDRGCSWVERLGPDAWLCDDVLLRVGAEPQFLGGALTTVGGRMVWTWNAGELRRFRNIGSGPLSPGPRFDTLIFDTQAFFATESEAVLVHPRGLTRVEVDSSGAIQASSSIDRPFGRGLVVTLIGEVVMTAALAEFETEVCTWRFSGALSAGGCRRYPGVPLGRADGGLLLRDGDQLRRIGPELDDGIAATKPTGELRLAGRGLAIFSGSLGDVIPRVQGTSFVFETYAPVSGADEDFVWTATNTTTTVMSR